jgi:hypothetical protein
MYAKKQVMLSSSYQKYETQVTQDGTSPRRGSAEFAHLFLLLHTYIHTYIEYETSHMWIDRIVCVCVNINVYKCK